MRTPVDGLKPCGPVSVAEVTGEDFQTVVDKMTRRGWLWNDGGCQIEGVCAYLTEAGYDWELFCWPWSTRLTVKRFLRELPPESHPYNVLVLIRRHVFVVNPMLQRWKDNTIEKWLGYEHCPWNRHGVRTAIQTWPEWRPQPAPPLLLQTFRRNTPTVA